MCLNSRGPTKIRSLILCITSYKLEQLFVQTYIISQHMNCSSSTFCINFKCLETAIFDILGKTRTKMYQGLFISSIDAERSTASGSKQWEIKRRIIAGQWATSKKNSYPFFVICFSIFEQFLIKIVDFNSKPAIGNLKNSFYKRNTLQWIEVFYDYYLSSFFIKICSLLTTLHL